MAQLTFDLDHAIAINPSACVLDPTPDIFSADVAATFPAPAGPQNSAHLPNRQWWRTLSPHYIPVLARDRRRVVDLQEPIAWKRRKF